jgi:hypothetical protein
MLVAVLMVLTLVQSIGPASTYASAEDLSEPTTPLRQMEQLNRGVVAVKADGVCLERTRRVWHSIYIETI